jgi:exodeoxyribonuclease X
MTSQKFDHYLVVDFETTGLSPGYRPLEIAWLEFDTDFNVIESVESLINPQMDIEPGAEKVHGISAGMVATAPTLDEFIKTHHGDKFRESNVLIVAHNAKFDFPMFAPYCGHAAQLCTMMLGLKLYPNSSSHQLGVLAKLVGVEKEPTHRALDDVETCFALLQHYSVANTLSIDGLIKLAQSFDGDSTMPFGKHKGTKIKDLPSDYASWLAKTLEPDHWVIQILKTL